MKALILDSEAISQLARGKSGRAKTLYAEAVANSVLVAVPAAVLASSSGAANTTKCCNHFWPEMGAPSTSGR